MKDIQKIQVIIQLTYICQNIKEENVRLVEFILRSYQFNKYIVIFYLK